MAISIFPIWAWMIPIYPTTTTTYFLAVSSGIAYANSNQLTVPVKGKKHIII